MVTRKYSEIQLVDEAEFRYWGIVISKYVWEKSNKDTAEKFQCSRSYVTQVMNKFMEDGGHVDHRKFNGGLNKKLKESVEKRIITCTTEHPNISSPQIVDQLQEHSDIREREVRDIRKKLGFTQLKGTALPILSEDTQKQRRKYCKRHQGDKFNNVVFSDESNFQLAANKQVLWYRRGIDEVPHLKAPEKNLKIMIWGGISRKGQTPLHIYRLDLKERANKETYVECLRENLLECMDEHYGYNGWKFIQDNAKPHAAHFTTDFFAEQEVRVLKHPSYSPDLNPIEKVWAWMKSEISQTTYDTVDELIDTVINKWNSMTLEYLNKLIDHHIKIVEEVLLKEGRYID